MFYAVGDLASLLKLNWYGPGMFWNALYLCHLGMMAGAVVSADQGYPVCPVLGPL